MGLVRKEQRKPILWKAYSIHRRHLVGTAEREVALEARTGSHLETQLRSLTSLLSRRMPG